MARSSKKFSKKIVGKQTDDKDLDISSFPNTSKILKFIEESPGRVGKREIARAFKFNAKQKMILKKVLRELKLSGAIQKGRGKQVRKIGTLPPVAILEVIGPDKDGDLMARPETWESENVAP